MCGRYANFLTEQELTDAFQIATKAGDERLLPEGLLPNFNLGPMQPAPVVVATADAAVGSSAERTLMVARWGLVPFWAKDPGIGAKMFNARGETVAEKPSFRNAFAKRRCLVPASGYYEWRSDAAGKQPFFIHATDGPLAFAGLWETWGKGDDALVTFSIVTTAARGEMRDIHDRQPVMLTPDSRDAWLDPDAERAELEAVIASEAPELAWHAVSRDVGNVRNNRPDLVEPVAS